MFLSEIVVEVENVGDRASVAEVLVFDLVLVILNTFCTVSYDSL